MTGLRPQGSTWDLVIPDIILTHRSLQEPDECLNVVDFDGYEVWKNERETSFRRPT